MANVLRTHTSRHTLFPKLKELWLSNSNLRDEGLAALLPVLDDLPELQKLHLTACNLDDEAGRLLQKVLFGEGEVYSTWKDMTAGKLVTYSDRKQDRWGRRGTIVVNATKTDIRVKWDDAEEVEILQTKEHFSIRSEQLHPNGKYLMEPGPTPDLEDVWNKALDHFDEKLIPTSLKKLTHLKLSSNTFTPEMEKILQTAWKDSGRAAYIYKGDGQRRVRALQFRYEQFGTSFESKVKRSGSFTANLQGFETAGMTEQMTMARGLTEIEIRSTKIDDTHPQTL